MRWTEAYGPFMPLLAARGVAPRTRNDYDYHLRRFSLLAQPDLSDDISLRANTLAYMANCGRLAPATSNTVLRKLRAFFRWAVEEGILATDPTRGLKKRREDQTPRCIDEGVIKRLLNLPSAHTHAGRRDRAAFYVMLDTAIRTNEMSHLLVSDVDLQRGVVSIRATVAKTRSTRVLPMSPITTSVLAEYIDTRDPAWGGRVPLFCTDSGRPMTRHLWAARLSVYSKKLGVKIRPYDVSIK